MIQDVKSFVSTYATIDEPIPYKGLFIYPVLVKDYYSFMISYDVLCIEKNNFKVKDIKEKVKIIQMNYLDFLIEKLMQDESIIDESVGYTAGMLYEEKLLIILTLCFKLEANEISYYKKEKTHVLIIKDVEISSDEFDEIIKIIMYQNVYDYFDDYIDPDFKKAVDDYYAIKNKGLKNPELEDKMSALTAMTGICKRDFLQMTYREFENVFHSSLDKMEYEIAKSAELSGNVKFDKPLDHWVYKRKKNRYEDAFVSADAVKDKISSVNG